MSSCQISGIHVAQEELSLSRVLSSLPLHSNVQFAGSSKGESKYFFVFSYKANHNQNPEYTGTKKCSKDIIMSSCQISGIRVGQEELSLPRVLSSLPLHSNVQLAGFSKGESLLFLVRCTGEKVPSLLSSSSFTHLFSCWKFLFLINLCVLSSKKRRKKKKSSCLTLVCAKQKGPTPRRKIKQSIN